MASVSILPKLFRWIFTAFEGVFALGALILCIAMLIDPHLPPGTHFGPVAIDIAGQQGSLALQAMQGDSNFTATAFRGGVTLLIERAGGLMEVVKHYGLPAVLVRLILFGALFDLLRRLFRNVGRGDSFTRQSVYLVQIIGGTLIVYSLVSAVMDNLFEHAMLAYLAGHAVLTVAGTALRLPAPDGAGLSHGLGFLLGKSAFLAGLLVLALSEVFRQGLAMKTENDLTV